MSNKDYSGLIKNCLKPEKRVVCGFNEDGYGRVVITTGIPREYKEGVITYEDQKTTSYGEYMITRHSTSGKARCRSLIYGKEKKNYK